MNPDLLHILQHTLGLDAHGQPQNGYRGCHDDEFPGCYRNRFVTDPSSPDGLKCEQLVSDGLMAKPSRQPSFIGGMTNYYATQAGYEAVKTCSPPPPRLTKAQRRWAHYREVREAWGISFKEYLNSPARKESEARAGV